MPVLHIRRPHALGLDRARELATRWTAEAEARFGMRCSPQPRDGADVVRFQRSGVQGELRVAADHFSLEARLGLVLGAFAPRIQAEIEANLDQLLAGEAGLPPTAA